MSRRKLSDSQKLLKYLFIIIGIVIGLAVLMASLQAFSGGADVRSRASNTCIPKGRGWSGWLDPRRFTNTGRLVVPNVCPPEPTRAVSQPTRFPTPVVVTTQTPMVGCMRLICLNGTPAQNIDGVCTCPPSGPRSY